jgi:hypothetical protein
MEVKVAVETTELEALVSLVVAEVETLQMVAQQTPYRLATEVPVLL